ncbi:MAG: polysaccharide deacetylase family protein [Solirubrobacteraceae bacterium]
MRPAAGIVAAAGAGAGAAWSLPAPAALLPSLCRSLGIVRELGGDRPVVALTFDDGPHPSGTPAVLDALEAAGARATFFLVGEQVRRWPAVAARIAAEGHTVALHGDRHRSLLRVAPATLARDLDRGHDAIAQATGIRSTLYRPPYGVFSTAGLAITRRRGWTPILWSRWGRDWTRRATPQRIATLVTENLASGDVLLLHDADHYSARDSWRATAAAVPLVLEELDRRGLASTRL